MELKVYGDGEQGRKDQQELFWRDGRIGRVRLEMRV